MAAMPGLASFTGRSSLRARASPSHIRRAEHDGHAPRRLQEPRALHSWYEKRALPPRRSSDRRMAVALDLQHDLLQRSASSPWPPRLRSVTVPRSTSRRPTTATNATEPSCAPCTLRASVSDRASTRARIPAARRRSRTIEGEARAGGDEMGSVAAHGEDVPGEDDAIHPVRITSAVASARSGAGSDTRPQQPLVRVRARACPRPCQSPPSPRRSVRTCTCGRAGSCSGGARGAR